MVISLVMNGILGFGFLIGLLFSVTDLEGALNSPTKSPILDILYQTLQSKAAATAFLSLEVVLAFCVEIGMVASTSRLTWAFARDKGLPFSRFFAHVSSMFADCGMVLTATGEPTIQDPATRYPVKRCNCDAGKSHQYCIVDSVQCYHFTDYGFPLFLLHAPHRHHGPAAAVRWSPQFWTFYAWSLWPAGKCRWTSLGHLFCHLRCVSHRNAGDCCQHELCVIGIRKRIIIQPCCLAALRSASIQGPTRRDGRQKLRTHLKLVDRDIDFSDV